MNQSYSSGTSCVFHARHWLGVRSAILAWQVAAEASGYLPLLPMPEGELAGLTHHPVAPLCCLRSERGVIQAVPRVTL